jgi:hypothetical protein
LVVLAAWVPPFADAQTETGGAVPATMVNHICTFSVGPSGESLPLLGIGFEREELLTPHRENKPLRLERDTLSRATGLFARDAGDWPIGTPTHDRHVVETVHGLEELRDKK